MTIRALRVRGSFRGPTGYDRNVRSFTRELVNAGVDVQLVDMPEWSARRLAPGQLDPWFESLDRPVDASLSLQFCMPHQVRRLGHLPTVNFTMFEADRIPAIFRNAAGNSVMTIVPEASSFQSWVEAGADPQNIRICPLGIDPDLFGVKSTPMPIAMTSGEDIAARQTRFLNLSEIVPRKNQIGLLRSWLLATTADDDAVLVIKAGGASSADVERVGALLPMLEEETGKSFSDAASVVLIGEIFADEEMPQLYASATHYISMSFGEGWDLPLMEAAASGLQLIAPNHTAYKTYLNPAIATLLPVRKVPAATVDGFGVYFKGASWWEPNLDAAVDAIRRAIEGREQTVASAQDFILGHYTWRHATARLLEILAEAERM